MDYNQNENNNQNNYVQQDPYQTYDYNNYGEPRKQSGLGIAALVVGILAFLINPLYLCSLLAIIFGIIGSCKKDHKKGCAVVGIILGVCSLICQIILDFVLTILSAGLGSISFFC